MMTPEMMLSSLDAETKAAICTLIIVTYKKQEAERGLANVVAKMQGNSIATNGSSKLPNEEN